MPQKHVIRVIVTEQTSKSTYISIAVR